MSDTTNGTGGRTADNTHGTGQTRLAATPGQTVGPFFGYALPYAGDHELVPAARPTAIRLHGRVLDGAGDPVPDALLEIRQADNGGVVPRSPGSLRRDGWTFTGWGRAATDAAGQYWFDTVLPSRTDGGPAFFALTVLARGLLDRLVTRIYVPSSDAGEEQALAADPLLSVLSPERRDTLIAHRVPDGLRFDVVLQGDAETVFLTHRPPR